MTFDYIFPSRKPLKQVDLKGRQSHFQALQ